MRTHATNVRVSSTTALKIALVSVERVGDRQRFGVRRVAAAAGDPLRDILRLVERQDALMVAVLVVIALREGFGPVGAVPGARLDHPSAVASVAPIEQH